MENLLTIKFLPADYLTVLLMVICIYTDIKGRRIYNKVLLPFLAAGLAANLLAGGLPGLMESSKGSLIGLGLLFIPFAMGGIGGGDVKLMAVIGAIKGPAFVLSTFLAGAIAGGILALALLIRHRRLLTTLSGCLASASNLLIRYGITFSTADTRDEEAKPLHLPYSLAIGTGVAVSYFAGLQSLLR